MNCHVERAGQELVARHLQQTCACHLRVNHSKGEYVRGNVYTNSIESAFSLLKRGVVGTYHQLSIKHLQRYLNEFAYRFNRREITDMFEETVRRLTNGKAIQYAQLTAKA